MNFLADESVDRQIVDVLRGDEHLVLYVAEMDPGIDDDEVLDKAEEDSAILITADKDFMIPKPLLYGIRNHRY
jgi:predicted nuclease of predicted toxin-antitoxin system